LQNDFWQIDSSYFKQYQDYAPELCSLHTIANLRCNVLQLFELENWPATSRDRNPVDFLSAGSFAIENLYR